MPGLDPISLGLSAAGIVGDIIGNLFGNSARKKQQDILNQQQSQLNSVEDENQNYYNQNYYGNALDRTENASALTRANQFFKQRTAQDRKTAAVTGATPEAVNADKSQYSNAYSNLVGNIAAGASNSRDRVRANYENQLNNTMNQQNNLNQLDIGLLNQKAQAAGNFAQNAGNVASSALRSGLISNTTPKAYLNVSGGIDPSNVTMP
jgi:hypothetical protein